MYKRQVYENNNRTLSRKKSSLSVLFRYLYREGIVSRNITDQFDPIRVQKPSDREIKALQDDEVMIMLDAVTTGDSRPLSDLRPAALGAAAAQCLLVQFSEGRVSGLQKEGKGIRHASQ